jgi:hypothetical protein
VVKVFIEVIRGGLAENSTTKYNRPASLIIEHFRHQQASGVTKANHARLCVCPFRRRLMHRLRSVPTIATAESADQGSTR